ncbi:MAG: O-antigen ligase family protein [bacterium]|nr:O-antigen ligase family protein [bacterium]
MPFILGFIVPLIPVFGSGWLLIAVALFLLLNLKKINPSYITPFIIFILILIIWTISYVFFGLGFSGIKALWEWNGIEGISSWFLQSSSLSYLSFVSTARYICILLLFALLKNSTDQRDNLISGMITGTFVTTLFSLILIFAEIEGPLPNQNEFWKILNRYSGTFTDPNAAGIFLVLMLPFIVLKGRELWGHKLMVIGTLLCTLFGFFTGSRSFILGIILFVFLYSFQKSRKFFLILLGIMLFALSCLIILGNSGLISFLTQLSFMPEGFRRILSGISDANINNSPLSRLPFIRIAWAMILDHPYGIGFENFRFAMHEYAQYLSLNLKGWSDGNNNFYLGLISELGILGFISLVLAFSYFKFDFSQKKYFPVLYVFLFLLLFGSHVSFDEVAILTSVILSLVLVKREFSDRFLIKLTKTAFAIILIVSLFAVPFAASKLEYGLFTFERGMEGTYRWTSIVAKKLFKCQGPLLNLKLRAMHAGQQNKNVNINFMNELGENISVDFLSTEQKNIEFACPNQKETYLYMLINPPWSPALQTGSKDDRILGVQLFESID